MHIIITETMITPAHENQAAAHDGVIHIWQQGETPVVFHELPDPGNNEPTLACLFAYILKEVASW